YQNEGIKLADFLAYDKPVLAPADGYIVELIDGVPDNPLGHVNLKNNWGNTVIMKIDEQFYAKLSHFKKGSIQVRKGDWVARGTQLGTCGNSGRSPEPHIHFQLQATPYVDSSTLEYPIGYYMKKMESVDESKSFSLPQQGDLVRNPEPIPLFHKLFTFIPGQRLKLKYILNNEESDLYWEVKTTAFNESYFECLNSGSKAFYQMDGQTFYFVHFEGNRKSPLYIFYLALFRVPLFYGSGTIIHDQFPPNRVFSKAALMVQDFIAPFALYLAGRYSLGLPDKQDLLGGEEISMKSEVRLCVFKQNIQSWIFNVEMNDSGLSLMGNSENRKIVLKWERNS
ncbi:MAG: M23 family metallopeptidase, partial [Bacteroidales bacterium]|nr:M23 family metallopeptidase [Bacteroidales bacterium]